MTGYHPLGDPGGAHSAVVPNTVLKWCGNGELSALDLERIVQRLRQADPVASSLQPSHFSAIQVDQAC
ncbi:MAG: hypothetical protein ACKO58_06635 [Cyanobium sp.]